MTEPQGGPGQDAGRSFVNGFAGCLGVGLAILLVIIAGIIILALASR